MIVAHILKAPRNVDRNRIATFVLMLHFNVRGEATMSSEHKIHGAEQLDMVPFGTANSRVAKVLTRLAYLMCGAISQGREALTQVDHAASCRSRSP